VAIWTGVMHVEGQYIYLCDADLSAAISEIKKLAIWVKEHNFDIVIASREGAGSRRVGEPLYRHIMGRIFNFFVRFLAISGVKDTQCGFKCFKREVIQEIFRRQTISQFSFDVELLWIALKHGYRIKEVPVQWMNNPSSKVNPVLDSTYMFLDLIKIRINDLRGLYH